MIDLEGRTIEVTDHAVNRLRRRRPDLGLARVFIREEVAAAIAAGRVFDHKPRRFRLYKSGGRLFQAYHRVVVTEDDALAFVVSLENDQVVVVTTLTPTGGARP